MLSRYSTRKRLFPATLVATILGGWYFFQGFSERSDLEALALRGEVTTGEVLSRRNGGRRRPDSLRVGFTTDAGRSVTTRIRFESKDWYLHPPGKALSITYLPENPEVAILTEGQPSPFRWFAYGVLSWTLAAILLYLPPRNTEASPRS